MTLPTDIASDVQAFSPGSYIELFQLDSTNLGGSILAFTNNTENASEVSFGGLEYQAIPVTATGFEATGNGQLPQPTITVSNLAEVVTAMVISLDDLIGAKVTRLRTFSKYLDGQPTADSTQVLPPDVYNIEQKTRHDKNLITWRLSASLDQEGKVLPAQRAFRNRCSQIYRFYDPALGDFNYAGTNGFPVPTCPYTGAASFDAEGNPTTDPQDLCAKQLSDCRLRFGQTAVLPFLGFPGMARV